MKTFFLFFSFLVCRNGEIITAYVNHSWTSLPRDKATCCVNRAKKGSGLDLVFFSFFLSFLFFFPFHIPRLLYIASTFHLFRWNFIFQQKRRQTVRQMGLRIQERDSAWRNSLTAAYIIICPVVHWHENVRLKSLRLDSGTQHFFFFFFHHNSPYNSSWFNK